MDQLIDILGQLCCLTSHVSSLALQLADLFLLGLVGIFEFVHFFMELVACVLDLPCLLFDLVCLCFELRDQVCQCLLLEGTLLNELVFSPSNRLLLIEDLLTCVSPALVSTALFQLLDVARWAERRPTD